MRDEIMVPSKSFSASTSISLVARSDGWSARQAQKVGRVIQHQRHHQSRLFSTGKSADFFIDIVSGKLERSS